MKTYRPAARGLWCALPLFLGGGAPACGAIWGIEAGTLEDGGADAAVSPGGRPDGDPLHGDASALPDGESTGGVVYVSPSGQDSGSCGTITAPCSTVQAGVTRAVALMYTSVFVAEGTYSGSLLLSGIGGVTIRGGLNADWQMLSGASASQAVVIQATSAKAVSATGLTGPVTFATLTIRSEAQADPGETLYGVFATNNPQTATLELDDVIVTVANGGDGAAGAEGTPGSPSGTTCGAGGDAGAGAQGLPAAAGTLAASGYLPGNGAPGQSGGVGPNGDAGAPDCQVCGTCDGLCILSPSGMMTCGTGGAAGCGGNGGNGGAGGEGGGSSIGVFAWNAPIVTEAGSVTVGNGGSGGGGGAGGVAAPGNPGGVSVAGMPCIVACSLDIPCDTTTAQGIGKPGSMGGAGGIGGAGGGGAGGSSYAVYVGGQYAPSFSGTTLTPGKAGLGDPGPPAAPSGQAKAEGP